MSALVLGDPRRRPSRFRPYSSPERFRRLPQFAGSPKPLEGAQRRGRHGEPPACRAPERGASRATEGSMLRRPQQPPASNRRKQSRPLPQVGALSSSGFAAASGPPKRPPQKVPKRPPPGVATATTIAGRWVELARSRGSERRCSRRVCAFGAGPERGQVQDFRPSSRGRTQDSYLFPDDQGTAEGVRVGGISS